MMIAMTIATIGRLMKNLAMAGYLASGGASLAGLADTGAGLAGTVHGRAFTGAPVRTFCTPSTTTFSPGFNPSEITHSDPTRSPTFTGRISALLSAPTIATE